MISSANTTWHGSKNAAGQLASIEKAFAFADFDSALAFANRVADIARAENHHPSLLVQWGSCVVRWSTHDAGHTVTERDVRGAELTDAAYG
ncbi:MAG: 4a-hydroxytetrahydrobiopterin dehydratase [Brachymonas sp.]|jgi:4a-hydroxytetrahydrobiopterin dehydratase